MAKITGIKELKTAVGKHKRGTARGFEYGLQRAGLFLQRESMKVVPVKTGDLKGSAATRVKGHGLKTEVRVGYGTEYAVYVHERVELRHKPGKQAKYLEQPFREHRDRLIEIVGEEILSEHGVL